MKPDLDTDVCAWITETALVSEDREALLEAYCLKLSEGGFPLMRLHVTQTAFHPLYGGLGFNWSRGSSLEREDYVHRDMPGEAWLQSPMYHMMRLKQSEIRLSLEDTSVTQTFPLLAGLRKRGGTEYVAMAQLFDGTKGLNDLDPDNPPSGMLISWTTDGDGGFSDAHVAVLRQTLPTLGLALKSASSKQTTRDLLEVYLGKGPGARVMSGEYRRGTLERIEAAILLFDISGFTALSEQADGHAVIALLNDYLGAAVDVIVSHDGQVLKFLGDGLLAIFNTGNAVHDVAAALTAMRVLNQEILGRGKERTEQGEMAPGFTLALHHGVVQYGNIGAQDRLDFTVIGAAVNFAARLAGMHALTGQPVILSEAVQRAAGPDQPDVVALGRYMLRGVSTPQNLFTLVTND